MRILVVDNYDSFVFNLVQYLGQLGESTTVWRTFRLAGNDFHVTSAGKPVQRRTWRVKPPVCPIEFVQKSVWKCIAQSTAADLPDVWTTNPAS